jgi:hypothetical protein
MDDTINYDYSIARIFIARLNSDDDIIDFIDGTYDFSRNTVLERVLEPGNYLIIANLDWVQKQDTHFTISIYGSHMVKLTRVERFETFEEIIKTLLKFYVFLPILTHKND